MAKSINSKRKITTVASTKGGVGKTITTSCIAEILSMIGYRVLMIDTDKSACLSFLYGYNSLNMENEEQKEFFENISFDDLFTDDVDEERIMRMVGKTEKENLFIIPSDPKAIGLEYKLYHLIVIDGYPADAVTHTFRENIEKIQNNFDYIFIDTVGDYCYVSKCAVAAAKTVLSPLKPEGFSVLTDNGVLDMISDAYKGMEDKRPEYMTFLNMKGNNARSRFYQEDFVASYGDTYVNAPIRYANSIELISSNKVTITDKSKKREESTLDFIRLVTKLGYIDRSGLEELKSRYVIKEGND